MIHRPPLKLQRWNEFGCEMRVCYKIAIMVLNQVQHAIARELKTEYALETARKQAFLKASGVSESDLSKVSASLPAHLLLFVIGRSALGISLTVCFVVACCLRCVGRRMARFASEC